MILGESGSGKSTSLRTFAPGEVCVLNVAGKRLPFRNEFGKNVVNLPKNAERLKTNRYDLIRRGVQSGKFKRYVIDDSQYLMAFDSFDRAKERGYDKFTDFALNFYNLLQACRNAADDTIIYFLHHCDSDERGFIRPKTQGKMLDQQLNVAGLFTIILLARTDGKRYWFETQNDGLSVAKSPLGMFADQQIPNDLALVDKTIRAYYGLDNLSTTYPQFFNSEINSENREEQTS